MVTVDADTAGMHNLVGAEALKVIHPFNHRTMRFLTILAAASAGVIAVAAQTPAGLEHLSQSLPQSFPDPTNIKVLPKNLTGLQVREIMNSWSGSLGVHCNTCHVKDADPAVATASAEARFADDSNSAKATARLMYTMTEEINSRFIANVEGSGMPVTCGTCHQGKISPSPFLPAANSPPGRDSAMRQILKPADYQNKPCTDCHTEFAQPLAYEHAPMQAEGCSACHAGHGSSNPHLLIQATVDAVCQQCHIPKPDPASGAHMPSSEDPTGAKPCTACHTQVHGSNSSPVFLNLRWPYRPCDDIGM